jgi:VCBS repeat-containing protein
MRTLLSIALALTPTLLSAQLPAGWAVRPDDAGKAAEVKVETMGPGWHVTTGPGGVIYRTADKATGTYEFGAKLHLFPEKGGHNEAYGLFIGGSDLAGAAQKYTYFVIRGDGTWKVKRRDGAKATDVTTGWTANPAIVKGKADGSVANLVTISVTGAKVSFLVNGTEVYSTDASKVDAGGTPGLRINHNLSVHVENYGIKVGG